MNKSTWSNPVERLESRQLLSVSHLPTFGSLGDSYTDEYHFYPPDRSTAQGWVEQLVHNKLATFGTATDKSRGTPRNKGYANDWALDGATSADLPVQTTGLAGQAAAGTIEYATILIGGNDFLDELELLSTDPSNAGPALATTASTLVANIEASVGTLLASSPSLKVAVATLPPVSDIPIVKSLETGTEAVDLVQAADAAEVQVNQAITAFAASNHRIAVADFAGATTSIAAAATFKIGKVTINTVKPSNNPHSLFLKDGLHLGTVGQGLLANVFIHAIDTGFGATIKPLTDKQILVDARLAT
jgi:hypothetical protein